MFEVFLLGQFTVQLNDESVEISSRKLRLLLAYLVLNAGQTLPREKVAGVLWPNSGENAARKNLRNYVWRLRKAIGEEYLAADKNTVAFRTESPYRFDVQILAQDADEGSNARLLEAVAAYRGELLPGHYEDWIQLERESLRALFERRMKELLERLESERRWAEVVSWAEQWLSLGQTAEPAYRSLMRGYAGLGDLAGVATGYDRCRQALVEDLGVEPSRETRALFERLLAEQEPQQRSGLSTETQPACPYRGLFAFREVDAPYFFGRELFTKQLVEAVRERPLVAVVGPSGSGKSSVIFAGLLARLRPETQWTIVTFRPTRDPFSALAAALLAYADPDSDTTARPGAGRELAHWLRTGEQTLLDLVPRILENNNQSDRLLLVGDQFEEVFTLCSDPGTLHAFFDLLLAPVTAQQFRRELTFTFLFTLRADFMEQALAHRPLADMLQPGAQIRSAPMIRGELRRAIVEPPRKLGITFERGLVGARPG